MDVALLDRALGDNMPRKHRRTRLVDLVPDGDTYKPTIDVDLSDIERQQIYDALDVVGFWKDAGIKRKRGPGRPRNERQIFLGERI